MPIVHCETAPPPPPYLRSSITIDNLHDADVNLVFCCFCLVGLRRFFARDARVVFMGVVQNAGGAGPAAGDAKAVKLVAAMEADAWGEGRLSEADRLGDFVFQKL